MTTKTREPKFKVGQRIAWESQSAGSWTKKEGKVLAILQPRQGIKATLRALNLDADGVLANAMDSARIVRYLVDTSLPGKRFTVYAPDLGRAEKRGKVV